MPSITVNSATICAGNTATLTVNGAATYTWNTGANGASISDSPSTTTNYTVVGTDGNACSNSATTVITVNNLPNISINSSSICIGSTATLTASGATTYTWNTGATGVSITDSPTTNTNYTVTGTDGNNCNNTATASVNINALPTLTITVNSYTICSGSQVTLTASGASSYTWSNNGSTGATINDSPTTTTNYTVTGADANNCINNDVASVIVNSCSTGIEQSSGKNNEVVIYPVPSNGEFTIEFADNDYQLVKVYDEIGREVYSQALDASIKNKSLKIDLSNLSNINGILTLQIVTTSGVVNKKVIVQK